MLFYGTDNFDQLVKINRVVGTNDIYDYVEKFDLDVSKIDIYSLTQYLAFNLATRRNPFTNS